MIFCVIQCSSCFRTMVVYMYNATLILAVVSNYMHGVLMNIHVLDSITTTKVRQLQYILVLTWRDKCYESCTI